MTHAHDKALVFCVDQAGLPYALLCAERAILLSHPLDFDVLVVSQDPLQTPDHFLNLGIRVLQIDLSAQIQRYNLPLHHYPKDTYSRLWLSERLSDRYRRILYLDHDTLVQTPDLGRLMDLDIGPHPFAAALDKKQWRKLGKPILDFKEAGLPYTRYFNAGVTLFDTRTFNDSGMLDRALDVLGKGHNLDLQDQSMLNLAARGQFAELHPVWNWQWARFRPFFQDFFGVQILHLTDKKKPWMEIDGQARFPASLVSEYVCHLRQHFPDRAPEKFRRHPSSGSYKELLYEYINHAEDLWKLRRYLRRFKDEFDVIL